MVAEPDSSRTTEGSTDPPSPEGSLRRRAAHLYGLIICGSVLAAAPDGARVWFVAAAVTGTLLIYWVAETYVHWMSARAAYGRRLTRPEWRAVVLDGFPLVAAGTIAVVVLLVEGVLRVQSDRAVRVALLVNVGLLLAVGWNMSAAGRLPTWQRVALTAMTGMLGVAMIGLKTLLH